jgi:farnesyl-diphosphate farnesyltransferase
MLTELFVHGDEALGPVAPYLEERAARFGEALQLVNILKDSAFDADEGRRYLPEAVDRATLFAMAREDLEEAGEYVRKLQDAGAARGIVEFTALPILLAWATLDRVERKGPGAKIGRLTVMTIVRKLGRGLDRGEPAV